MRRTTRGLVVAAAFALPLLSAAPALAHPLGNSSTNLYSGLRIEPDRVVVDHVVDLAELRTVQITPAIDTDGNAVISPDELTAYAGKACNQALTDMQLTVGDRRVPLAVEQSEMAQLPGQAGLKITRIGCRLTAPVTVSGTTPITFADSSYLGRFGWHEITAVGDGTTLVQSDVPTESPSKRLTAYPTSALSATPDIRAARLEVKPGGARLSADATNLGLPVGVLPRGVDRLTSTYLGFIGQQHLGIGLGLLGILLAIVLGSAHAVAPGHGKTVMAAYLVGQRGNVRQAALLGGVVTLTHTLGVLTLGVVISVSASVASEQLVPWMEVASGALLALIGLALLRSALARRRAWARGGTMVLEHPAPGVQSTSLPVPDGETVVQAIGATTSHAHQGPVGAASGLDHEQAHHSHGPHDHSHDHEHPHDHSHDHDHDHDHSHDHADQHSDLLHDHGFGAHRHVLPDPERPFSRRSLAAMGVAGGLVPSPSALVVLLGAVVLGRAWFGVVLVVAYGLGMALTLTLAGLALLRARTWLDRPGRRAGRPRLRALASTVPVLTATVILGVSLFIIGRGVVVLERIT